MLLVRSINRLKNGEFFVKKMASEGGGTPGGGGGGPKKNSPQDYLFGRIIGEGEVLMYFY
jgi:hypothetical protein